MQTVNIMNKENVENVQTNKIKGLDRSRYRYSKRLKKERKKKSESH